jgi:antitoxin MazE
MRSTVSKWGNSLALRLPHALAEDLELVEGTEVVLKAADGKLVATLAKPKFTLDELLSGVTDETRRGEIDWGPAQGKEIW